MTSSMPLTLLSSINYCHIELLIVWGILHILEEVIISLNTKFSDELETFVLLEHKSK